MILCFYSGQTNETVKEVDASFNGSEKTPVAQRLVKTDYHLKPAAAHLGPAVDYRPHFDQPPAQPPEIASPVKRAPGSTPTKSASSQLAASTSPATMSPSFAKASGAPVVSGSPTSASMPPVLLSPNTESSSRPNASSAPTPETPPRVPSPHAVLQGLRPASSAATQKSPARSMHTSVESSFHSSALPVSSTSGPSLVSISGSLTSTPPGSSLSKPASPTTPSVTPSADSRPREPASSPQRQTHTPSAANAGLSTAAATLSPPEAANLPSLAAYERPTVRPQSALPLLTTEASKTASVSAPSAFVFVPPAMGTSCGGTQSVDSELHSHDTGPQALKLSPKPERHSHSEDRTALGIKRNGKPEEHLHRIASDTTHKLATSDQKSRNEATDFQRHHMQTSAICQAEEHQVEQNQMTKASSASQHQSHCADKEALDNSLLSTTRETPSGMEASSVMKKTLGLDSVDDGDSSVSYADEEPSTIDSSFRDDTMDSTRETSEAEETKNSRPVTGESMLESSLNNTSQMEEPSESNSQALLQPRPGYQGTFL